MKDPWGSKYQNFKYRISINLFFLCRRLQYALLGTASVALCPPAKLADWTVLIQSFTVSEGGALNRGMLILELQFRGSRVKNSDFIALDTVFLL